MAVRMSAPFFAAALLAWMPAFAQTSECTLAGAADGGDAGEAEGCPDPHGPPTPDTRGLDSNWDSIQLDHRRDRIGAHPWDAGTPLRADLCAATDTDDDDIVDGESKCTAVGPTGPRGPTGPADPTEPRDPMWPRDTAASQRSWTVDFEAVAGRAFVSTGGEFGYSMSAVTGSLLATVRLRPALPGIAWTRPLSVGVVVPFGAGSARNAGCCPWRVESELEGPYARLGSIALAGTWEVRISSTRIPLGVQLAFPTAVVGSVPPGTSSPAGGGDYATFHADLTESPRGFEDPELFHPGFAVVPNVAVQDDFGPVEISCSAKLALRFLTQLAGPNAPASVVDFVGVGQLLFRVVDLPGVGVSAGVRALALYSHWSSNSWGGETFGAAIEPRLEVRVGALGLRGGFILPFRSSRYGTYFPEAWGVRVGVGYSF